MRSRIFRVAGVVFSVYMGAVLALASDEVYSPNVVGFQKLTGSTNRGLVTTVFNVTNSDINKVIGEQLCASNPMSMAGQISFFIPTSQTYKTYYLAAGFTRGDLTNLNHKWADAENRIATNAVIPGVGFWMSQPPGVSNQMVVVCGEVLNSQTYCTNILPGMQIISYPYAADVYLTQTTFLACGAYATNPMTLADQVSVWNPDSQKYKTYYLAAGFTRGELTNLNHRWADAENQIGSNVVLKCGEGFWYKHASTGFVWCESRPYSF
jgi:hypothetical protein